MPDGLRPQEQDGQPREHAEMDARQRRDESRLGQAPRRQEDRREIPHRPLLPDDRHGLRHGLR